MVMLGLRGQLDVDDRAFGDMAMTFRVLRLAGVWRTLLDRELKSAGMRLAGMRPMAYLMMMPAGMSQRDLAMAMNTDASALVRVLDNLEQDGLLERRPDTADRRTNRLYLTPAGQDQCARFREISSSVERTLLDGLPKDAVNSTIENMEYVLRNAEAVSVA